MRLLGNSGIWELFVPGVGAGTAYKFRASAAPMTSSATSPDLMARRTWSARRGPRGRPRLEIPVADDTWQETKKTHNPHTGPMSIYEVHLGSWRAGLSYAEPAEHLVNYVTDLASPTSSSSP